jgi:hypothetical protein
MLPVQVNEEQSELGASGNWSVPMVRPMRASSVVGRVFHELAEFPPSVR